MFPALLKIGAGGLQPRDALYFFASSSICKASNAFAKANTHIIHLPRVKTLGYCKAMVLDISD